MCVLQLAPPREGRERQRSCCLSEQRTRRRVPALATAHIGRCTGLLAIRAAVAFPFSPRHDHGQAWGRHPWDLLGPRVRERRRSRGRHRAWRAGTPPATLPRVIQHRAAAMLRAPGAILQRKIPPCTVKVQSCARLAQHRWLPVRSSLHPVAFSGRQPRYGLRRSRHSRPPVSSISLTSRSDRDAVRVSPLRAHTARPTAVCAAAARPAASRRRPSGSLASRFRAERSRAPRRTATRRAA